MVIYILAEIKYQEESKIIAAENDDNSASHLDDRHIASDMWPDLIRWMRSFLKDHDPDMKEDYVNSDGTLDEYFLVSLFGTVLFQDLWKILVVYGPLRRNL